VPQLIVTFAKCRRSLLHKSAAGRATRAQDVLIRFRVDYQRYAGDDYLVELIERLNSVSSGIRVMVAAS
jgi:hypothetical protein